MLAIRIQGATRFLGAPSDWKDDGRSKLCGGLAVRDERTSVGHTMTSAWELEPREIEALRQGATIYLTVCGIGHPPVSLRVGAPPDETDGAGR